MKSSIPASCVLLGHPDFDFLSQISDEIIKRGLGIEALKKSFSLMLRSEIDAVIQTARTNRRSYQELEKTEKTYIGTRVEIAFRSSLKLEKGQLDTVILGRNVDIKFTIGNNWMIPSEAINQTCILIAADEDRATAYLGLIIAKSEYLSRSGNRDGKKSISADGFKHIFWIFRDLPYPSNFWKHIPQEVIEKIFSETSGNRRVASLFREIQRIVITREVLESVAQQKDFTRRLRRDDSKGVRDILKSEGIEILSGAYDKKRIAELKLPVCTESEFISVLLS